MQHRTFEWQVFEQGNFEVHHYREGDQIAGQVTRMLQREADALAPMFGRQLEGPLQVLVFNSQEEFRQSNVGVMLGQDEASNLGGSARLVGSKMFVYATGDRGLSRGKCVRGWRKCCSTKPCTRPIGAKPSGRATSSSPILDVRRPRPLRGAGLDAASQETILDLCRRDAFRQLELASGMDAALLGQAMWSYVADIYGLPTVANVLYMTRVTQSVESGFRLATGPSCRIWPWKCKPTTFVKRQKGTPPCSRHSATAKRCAKLGVPWGRACRCGRCPGSRTPSFCPTLRATWRRSRPTSVVSCGWARWTWTAAHAPGTPRWATGWTGWTTNCILGWPGASGPAPVLFGGLEGCPHLGIVNLGTGEVDLKELFQIDQVLDMACSPDGRYLLMSALQHGQSDLYRYDIVANNHTRCGGTGSTTCNLRFGQKLDVHVLVQPTDDTLRNDRLDHPYPEALDLYVGDLADDPITLTRWTATPDVDERHPQPLRAGNS